MQVFFYYIEYLWTFIPFIVILVMFIPFFLLSFNLFSYTNYFTCPSQIVASNQWFWEFFYSPDLVLFNSMISSVTLYNLITLSSNDVIHCFYLPFFFVKTDCVPGLLSTLSFTSGFSGIFHGYCAQICGLNHSNMCFSLLVFS
jgi:heme/copper-type cytochrome/quinol oxidase subunit 2